MNIKIMGQILSKTEPKKAKKLKAKADEKKSKSAHSFDMKKTGTIKPAFHNPVAAKNRNRSKTDSK